jgi:hypothetical protein
MMGMFGIMLITSFIEDRKTSIIVSAIYMTIWALYLLNKWVFKLELKRRK